MVAAHPKRLDPDAPIAVIDIGNTSTHLAQWQEGKVSAPAVVPTHDAAAVEEAFDALRGAFARTGPAAVVIASVVPDATDVVREMVARKLDRQALVVGEQIPLPLEHDLLDARTLGVDRMCAAAAAFHQLQDACVIVDFGSAVTVDLVDEEGTYQGGAILPGVNMQLRALHEFTAALPEVEPGTPEHATGRNTIQAMQLGVGEGIIGAVQRLVERYAESIGRWPQVVATGGDLTAIAARCEYLDSLVPDLTLRGIGLAYRRYLAERGA
jgi:type III pantothenate kinase